MSKIDGLRKIDICSWLEARGHGSVRETGGKVYFKSPFRPSETKPSFVVFRNNNSWVDYGRNNKPSSIIDLVMEIEGCNLLEAMDILSEDKQVTQYEPIDIISEPLITVSSVYDTFVSPELILYLKSRKIPKEIYSKYTKEAHYWFKENPDRIYRAVGFCNNSGGWELRNSQHKYCTSPKDSTTFLVGSSSCAILEGVFDFLSAVAYFGESLFENDVYVLNGLGQTYRYLDAISRYKIVNSFLDKGIGASNMIDLIRSRLYDGILIDHRCMFDENSKDFNEFWCNLNK